MTLTVNFINTDQNLDIEQFIRSLVMKTFNDAQQIECITVNLSIQNNSHVPWHCHIQLDDNDKPSLEAKSQAANYLTAFSQALVRLKRYWDKEKGMRA